MKTTKTIEHDIYISDISGKEMSGGWAIVRIHDRLEVAHFQYLNDLKDSPGKLFRAATNNDVY